MKDNVAFIEKASIVFGYKSFKFRESSMPVKPNSPEARDVAYLVHPYTNLRANEEQGPMIIEKGEECMFGTMAVKNILRGWLVSGRPH